MADLRTIREINLDKDSKARLENAAFIKHSSLSELVREILTEAVDGKYDDVNFEINPRNGRGRVGLVVDDDLWEASSEAAWRMRLSRSEMVRLATNLKYQHIPIDRKKVTR